MNDQNIEESPHPKSGNIWGWKFSLFSLVLIAFFFVIAFVIGEGPGRHQYGKESDSPGLDSMSSIKNADTIPSTIKDSTQLWKDSLNKRGQ